jgi:hypothetical protein
MGHPQALLAERGIRDLGWPPGSESSCTVILSGVVVREASDNVVEGSLASRFLKQARPDLLPRNDIARILFMPGDAVIKLRSLRLRQRCGVRFQAFPRPYRAVPPSPPR